MIDNRFPDPSTDARFPTPGADARFPDAFTDARFPDPATDTRFMGAGYGGGYAARITAMLDYMAGISGFYSGLAWDDAAVILNTAMRRAIGWVLGLAWDDAASPVEQPFLSGGIFAEWDDNAVRA